ncbi:MAG: hypothetical protein L0216_09935 [Planctomycetales bacterium]|nr:hypothetical protein [Planctomycetales bacterium]
MKALSRGEGERTALGCDPGHRPSTTRGHLPYIVAVLGTFAVFIAGSVLLLDTPGYSSTEVSASRGPFGVTVRVVATAILAADAAKASFALDEVLDPEGRLLKVQSVVQDSADVGVGTRAAWLCHLPDVPPDVRTVLVRGRLCQGRRSEAVNVPVPIR